ncbi:LysR family transcriptional regulator [Pseudomonas sp. MAFF 311095]|uniref:LysR family transcriptional regulator n=1 Tax=Pseudomonas petroselini TaxID=2899822 RepID=UPI0020B1FED6|nr:LysR family transcriptional regulator [Pseudomonas petroselini]MCD7081227.1 LysR family transcriptional regulator [Pseudomonas petroselini]
MDSNEQLLLKADLQSLMTFLVVYRERNVSRAAACLGVKQPAVSNTLSKLRKRFNDELFIRNKRLLPHRKSHRHCATA